jgi:hypothetical protein
MWPLTGGAHGSFTFLNIFVFLSLGIATLALLIVAYFWNILYSSLKFYKVRKIKLEFYSKICHLPSPNLQIAEEGLEKM